MTNTTNNTRSAEHFAEIYEWLDEAIYAAMMVNDVAKAINYATYMRAMENTGVVDGSTEMPETRH